MKGRYRSITPVTDFSVSQAIKVALIDAGHTDLAIESITMPIRELEIEHAMLEKRVMALEQERVKFQTESGVHRIIHRQVNQATAGIVGKAATWIGGALLAAVGAVLSHWIWQPK